MTPFTLPFIASRWNTSAISPTITSSTPLGLGAIQVLESKDFDASGDGTHIPLWHDQSANSYNVSGWTTWTNFPRVDQTIKANGHATIGFIDYGSNQYSAFNIGKFLQSGYSGLEIFMVGQHNTTTLGGFHGASFLMTQEGTFSSHHPYSDDHFYENFGTNTRLDLGVSPVNFTTRFRVYNISSKADGSAYNVYMDLSGFYSSNSYTYSYIQPNFSEYYYGVSRFSSNIFPWIGNMAAIYLFNRVLTSGERDQMRTYCRNTWGTNT
jgi:hypothetical protein